MSTIEWSDVERVLSAVIELPKAERIARLTELCGNSAALRADVESLLASHDSAESFMEAGPQVLRQAAPGSSMVGKHLGPYRLLEAIGQGGMGTVYRAQRTDGRFQKQVAIKVALGALHSPELLRRFSGEQQILATLEHPNISRLLDAGVSPEGVPFLVMEYVEGTPLNEYSRARKLSVRQRLALFQVICSAVNYAHQHLVVHRDIKPGNILVTFDGTPKLLDFGIAKIIDDMRGSSAEATQSMLNPMTPSYASPEQACGRTLTTVTDIYSLGVVLYELLTDQRPYEATGKPLDEAMRVICETEPEKPSTIMRGRQKNKGATVDRPAEFSSDLDAIVAKAMRKDPQQRYASSSELANDLSRYLSGLPVSAHKGSFRYVVGKFIARRKIAVLASTLVLLLTVAGVSVTIWQARIAEQQREKAERRFDQVRSLAKSLIFDVHDSIKDLPGTTPARQILVNRALAYLDGLSKEATGDRSLQRELAAAYERVADVQGNPYVANLGDATGATASYRKSLAILEPLFEADPGNVELRLELSGTYWKTGICLDANSDHPGALLNLQKALALTEEARSSDDGNSQDRLAGDHWAIGHVLQQMGRFGEALQNYQQAASIRESVTVSDAAQGKALRTHLAGDYYGMAEVLKSQGHIDLAEDAAHKSLVILQELAKSDPENETLRGFLASSYTFMGVCLEEQKQPNKALENYGKAKDIYETAVAADSSDALSHRLLGYIEMQIGRAQVKQGKTRNGLETLHRSLGIFQDLARRAPKSNYIAYNFGNVYAEIAVSHVALASDPHLAAREQIEHWREARSWYLKSLEIWLELRRQGKLAGDEVGGPERVPKEIARCDKALARLHAATAGSSVN